MLTTRVTLMLSPFFDVFRYVTLLIAAVAMAFFRY